MPENGLGNQGPSVDSHGEPVVDPTKNVLDLVAAAIQRQDDLREAETHHLNKLMDLDRMYQEKLAAAETHRIDAIRAVDVDAVTRAAAVSATQAAILAAQVATSAEAMRNQVAAAATAATAALAAALEPIQKDIADLRRAQYEQQGQKAGADDSTTDRRAGIMVTVGVLSIIVAVLVAAITIIISTR